MRRFIRQIHLWIGLLAGAVLSVVGITGSLYVFQPELTVRLYPSLYQTGLPEAAPMPIAQVVKRAEQQFGKEVVTINFPSRELQNYILKVRGNKKWLFFDSRTGSYLGEMEERRGVMDQLLKIHRTLTVGETGSLITGSCALLLAFVLVSSGLFLWFPRKKKHVKDRLRFKANASFKRRTFDLHQVTGFYFSIPLAVIAITGAYFAFPKQTQSAVNTLWQTAEPMPEAKKLKSGFRPDLPSMNIYQALSLMDQYHRDYHKRYLILPPDSVGYVYFSYIGGSAIGSGPQYRPAVYLDQYTGAELYNFDPVRAPLGHQVTRNWFIPIHFGEIGGLLTRILWFLMGLLPAMFWVTGIIMWRNRSGKRKAKGPGKKKKQPVTPDIN